MTLQGTRKNCVIRPFITKTITQSVHPDLDFAIQFKNKNCVNIFFVGKFKFNGDLRFEELNGGVGVILYFG